MISILQLAKRMGYSRQRINQLIKECESLSKKRKIKLERGKIDEIEFFLAYIDLIEDKHKKAISNESELEKEQIRLRRAQANRVEMENLIKKETLVPRSISVSFMAQVFGNIRNKLLGSKNRIAFETFGSKTLKENKIKIDGLVNELLQALSDPEKLYKNIKVD